MQLLSFLLITNVHSDTPPVIFIEIVEHTLLS